MALGTKVVFVAVTPMGHATLWVTVSRDMGGSSLVVGKRAKNAPPNIKMKDIPTHWQSVYLEKGEDDLSWHEENPRASLELVREFAPNRGSRIIDVGGGTSRLVEKLAQDGYESLTLLDISPEALSKNQARMRVLSASVSFVATDILKLQKLGPFDLWHDRAVFHFLNNEGDQEQYARTASASIVGGGHLVMMVFALDGPDNCSGLPVSRYDVNSLAAKFAPHFSLVKASRLEHSTPWGKVQLFTVAVLERLDEEAIS